MGRIAMDKGEYGAHDMNQVTVQSVYPVSQLNVLPFQDSLPSITLLTQRALSPGRPKQELYKVSSLVSLMNHHVKTILQ